jgi:hypothetical protein
VVVPCIKRNWRARHARHPHKRDEIGALCPQITHSRQDWLAFRVPFQSYETYPRKRLPTKAFACGRAVLLGPLRGGVAAGSQGLNMPGQSA